jgi:hypothetical protein
MDWKKVEELRKQVLADERAWVDAGVKMDERRRELGPEVRLSGHGSKEGASRRARNEAHRLMSLRGIEA